MSLNRNRFVFPITICIQYLKLFRTVFIKERYSSFDSELGQRIRGGKATLAELASRADELGAPALPGSGRQEYLESVVNQILFGDR